MTPKMQMEITICLIALTSLVSPLYVVRWNYFGRYPTTLLELMIWIVIIGWIISKLVSRNFSIKTPPITLCLLVVTIFLASIISVLISTNGLVAAFGIWRSYFLEPIVLFFIIYDVLVQTKGHTLSILRWNFSTSGLLLRGQLAAGIWLSLVGIAQYFLKWPIITNHQLDRAHGVFNNGNALALFLGPLIVILLAHLIKNKTLTKIQFTIVGLLGIAFLLTKSTGGLMAIFCTFVIVLIGQKLDLKKYAPTAMAILFVIFISFLILIPQLTPKVDNPWVRSGGTAQIRLCVWEGSWQLVKNNLFLGVGLTGFQKEYSSKYITCDAEPLVYPHNIFLNFWSELGLLGLAGFLCLFSYIFSKTWNIYTPAFLYILIHGLVDVPYFKNDLSVMFWMLLCLWVYSVISEPAGGRSSSV